MPKSKFDAQADIAKFLANGGQIQIIPRGKRGLTEAQIAQAVRNPRSVYPIMPHSERFAGMPSALIAQDVQISA